MSGAIVSPLGTLATALGRDKTTGYVPSWSLGGACPGAEPAGDGVSRSLQWRG
jgi:hypothetical protein